MLNPLIYDTVIKPPFKVRFKKFIKELLCDHYWVANQYYGRDAWLCVNVKIESKCSKCGLEMSVSSDIIDEYPDHLCKNMIYL